MMQKNQKGQALISLLFFVIIALFLISAAVMMLVISAQSTGKVEGEEAISRVAETGAETGILKLLRDPTYTGEKLILTDGTADISVTGGIVTVAATNGTFNKKLVVGTSLANNVLSVSSWKETY